MFRQIETTMPGWGFLETPRIGIAGLGMSLLPRKGVLAITAIIDVALNAHNGPVNSRALAKNQRLGPRYLESGLQALVREGILKAVRTLGCAKIAQGNKVIPWRQHKRAAGASR